MNERRQAGSDRRRPATSEEADGWRVAVKKTWKLYIGGAFVRSESGHSLVTADGDDNYPHGTRKDLRDAVKAAIGAQPGWAGRTAYNRGQILYRLAEVLEARRSELVHGLVRGGSADAETEVSASIDRVVSYAGWSDKYQSLLATSNPVAGPHFGFSVPEPVGVVGIVAPERPSLLGLVGSICPVIVSGNAAVVLGSEADPRTALGFCEALATSDLPGGVVNVLTGRRSELLSHFASHMGLRALDLWNVDDETAKPLEVAATENVKRVTRRALDERGWYDTDRTTSPSWIHSFVETKTIWHPMGA